MVLRSINDAALRPTRGNCQAKDHACSSGAANNTSSHYSWLDKKMSMLQRPEYFENVSYDVAQFSTGNSLAAVQGHHADILLHKKHSTSGLNFNSFGKAR
jgi:hypothetical protein